MWYYTIGIDTKGDRVYKLIFRQFHGVFIHWQAIRANTKGGSIVKGILGASTLTTQFHGVFTYCQAIRVLNPYAAGG